MLKKNGELFHIDFGHFLGHFKTKMGIKRERAPFVFTKQFQNVLGGEKGKRYLDFKNKFWLAYQVLRKNAAVLVTLLRILLVTEIPELDEKSIRYLEMTLCLNGSDEEAKKFLEDKLEESMNSWSVELNFWIYFSFLFVSFFQAHLIAYAISLMQFSFEIFFVPKFFERKKFLKYFA